MKVKNKPQQHKTLDLMHTLPRTDCCVSCNRTIYCMQYYNLHTHLLRWSSSQVVYVLGKQNQNKVLKPK